MEWSEVLPPSELTEFLRGIKLQQYDVKLAALGYEDVDDFANFDEAERGRFRAALEGSNILGGHVDKIIRAVAARARAAPLHEAQQQQAPLHQAQQQQQLLLPIPPSSAAGSSLPLASTLPAAAVHAAALDVGATAAAMHNKAHVAKVRNLIDDQKKLNPDAPRLVFGRGNTAPIKDYEAAVNAAALPLLEANPGLVSFSGGRMQTGPLIEAAKVSTTPTSTTTTSTPHQPPPLIISSTSTPHLHSSTPHLQHRPTASVACS